MMLVICRRFLLLEIPTLAKAGKNNCETQVTTTVLDKNITITITDEFATFNFSAQTGRDGITMCSLNIIYIRSLVEEIRGERYIHPLNPLQFTGWVHKFNIPDNGMTPNFLFTLTGCTIQTVVVGISNAI